ncbi:MAG: response regulator [Oscillospiraceae bacterium]|jgi:signal transduction histidine kinase/DNA-binding response OmpR family regulator|nr:response regulator [Oscillospiraceae bacterium]
MKKIKAYIVRYVFSETLSLDARLLNMVCMVGVAACLMSTFTRVLMRQGAAMILVMLGITFSVAFFLFLLNRFQVYRMGTPVTLILLGDVLFPAAFFLLGGADSGMAAYFALSVSLIILLSQGITRVILLSTHIIIVITCYCVALFMPQMISPLTPPRQTMDNIQSLIVVGFFIGTVILFQRAIFEREKRKVETAGSRIARQDELLHVVNDMAIILLSSDPDRFEEVLDNGMEMVARSLEIDRMYIWKNREHNGDLYYTQIYEWSNDDKLRQSVPMEFSYRDTLPDWEKRLSEGLCVNGPLSSLSKPEWERIAPHKVLSILAAPVFLQDEFWGFVSFDDCGSERTFSKNEENILRSGSLLMVNAILRNEMLQSLISAREDALLSAQAKSEFLANMSHEIRTPINAVVGMTAIGKSASDMERKDYCFGKIEDASAHLLGVINDILDMSKIEAGKLELSPVSFSFEKMFRRVVNVINFRVEEKNQTLSVRLDRNIPSTLIGDDQRLAQVIANLLSNAVKFTPEQGSIRVDTRFVKEENGRCTIRIDVSDSGIGISEDQLNRLFNSFTQADSDTSRKYGGTGLGLAISKRIVEMMGGQISARSELGKGSVFTFTAELERGEDGPNGAVRPTTRWDNVRVLLVDDEQDMRDHFSEIARQIGFHCDAAADGESAMRMIAENGAYDLYFVDWRMPGMDGMELTRRIKANDAEHSIVIMISATEWNTIETEAKSVGVDMFLPKPIFPSAITDCINECLGLYGALPVEVQTAEATDDFAGYRVLLAEDVEINREIVLALLEPTDLAVDCAENGAEAVEMYSADPTRYDMIFMDVQMPEMDGYTATQRIRALESPDAERIPIIAMTANVFREDVERCLAAGMNDHVGKPLDFSEVLDKLRRYLPERPRRGGL